METAGSCPNGPGDSGPFFCVDFPRKYPFLFKRDDSIIGRNTMKPAPAVLRDFEATAAIWKEWLGKYGEDEFVREPEGGGWSIGQVYFHLVNGTRQYQLRQVALCLEGKWTVVPGGKKFPGKVIFALGSFLPVRVTVPPSETYTPKQPAGIASMKAGLDGLCQAMRETAPRIAAAAPDMKAAHPILGFLNAAEWYQLIEMHFRHHLRQKRRIDRLLGR
jgi:hypothetical protein